MNMFQVSGFGGIILLGLDIWALIEIFGARISTGAKVMWILLVVILPFLGFVIWLFFGPRSERQR